MSLLDKILEEVKIERQRQIDLPGSEYDLVNEVNDWIAIASHYLTQDCTRKGIIPTMREHQATFEATYGVKVDYSADTGIWKHMEFPTEQDYLMALLKWA